MSARYRSAVRRPRRRPVKVTGPAERPGPPPRRRGARDPGQYARGVITDAVGPDAVRRPLARAAAWVPVGTVAKVTAENTATETPATTARIGATPTAGSRRALAVPTNPTTFGPRRIRRASACSGSG